MLKKLLSVIIFIITPSFLVASPFYDTKLLDEAPISVFERALKALANSKVAHRVTSQAIKAYC